MMQFGLIGIGAGAAAALLFASVTTGSILSIVLFYLAPLPLMIAGLGWSHWAALLAAALGSLAIAVIFGGVFVLAFVTGVAAPACWLCYLSALARPASTTPAEAPTPLEWYPAGRLVLWAAVLGALVVTIAISNFGLDAESFRSGLAAALSTMLHVETSTPTGEAVSMPGIPNAAHVIDFLVMVVPPAAAVIATITNLLNFWLAARVVKLSGHLARPWPDISAMSFPPLAAAGLAVALALTFTGGLPAIVASVFAAGLITAYGVLGFAVLHAITRGRASRPVIIGGIYAAVIVFGWPMLMLSLLGLVETIFGLRARAAARVGQPTV